MSLTQERLKELLHYDPETGEFTWIVTRAGTKKFKIAGCFDVDGQGAIKIDGNRLLISRLAFLYMEGYWPENMVMHIDKNSRNNKWVNLSEGSISCSVRNCNISKRNTSGVTGVSWSKQPEKWRVSVSNRGIHIYIGEFKVFTDAVIARRKAEIQYNYDDCNKETSAAKYLKNI